MTGSVKLENILGNSLVRKIASSGLIAASLLMPNAANADENAKKCYGTKPTQVEVPCPVENEIHTVPQTVSNVDPNKDKKISGNEMCLGYDATNENTIAVVSKNLKSNDQNMRQSVIDELGRILTHNGVVSSPADLIDLKGKHPIDYSKINQTLIPNRVAKYDLIPLMIKNPSNNYGREGRLPDYVVVGFEQLRNNKEDKKSCEIKYNVVAFPVKCSNDEILNMYFSSMNNHDEMFGPYVPVLEGGDFSLDKKTHDTLCDRIGKYILQENSSENAGELEMTPITGPVKVSEQDTPDYINSKKELEKNAREVPAKNATFSPVLGADLPEMISAEEKAALEAKLNETNKTPQKEIPGKYLIGFNLAGANYTALVDIYGGKELYRSQEHSSFLKSFDLAASIGAYSRRGYVHSVRNEAVTKDGLAQGMDLIVFEQTDRPVSEANAITAGAMANIVIDLGLSDIVKNTYVVLGAGIKNSLGNARSELEPGKMTFGDNQMCSNITGCDQSEVIPGDTRKGNLSAHNFNVGLQFGRDATFAVLYNLTRIDAPMDHQTMNGISFMYKFK